MLAEVVRFVVGVIQVLIRNVSCNFLTQSLGVLFVLLASLPDDLVVDYLDMWNHIYYHVLQVLVGADWVVSEAYFREHGQAVKDFNGLDFENPVFLEIQNGNIRENLMNIIQLE